MVAGDAGYNPQLSRVGENETFLHGYLTIHVSISHPVLKTFSYTFLYIVDYLTNIDTSSTSMSASAILSSKTFVIFIIDHLTTLGSISLSVLKTFLYIIDYLTTMDISPSMSASFILSS